MVIKYNCNVSKEAVKNTITRLTNQIYKVLPLKEENKDWKISLNLDALPMLILKPEN